MQRLSAHGFLDVDLTEDCSNLCEIIPRAREIVRIGDPQIIHGQPWRFLERSVGEPGTHVGWAMGDLYREGSYGKIYKAQRMVVKRRPDGLFDIIEPRSAVIVKQTEPPAGSSVLPAEDIQAHTSEALLHVLAWQTMQRTVAPWAVPRPFEVFGDHSAALPGWRSMSLCMAYVSGRTLHSYLKKRWRHSTRPANARLLLEILAQAAYILGHLQSALRLNHRDVKVNNLLIRRRRGSGAEAQPITLEMAGQHLTTTYELTLIDFGFACVGCPPPRVPITVFQAGSWFPSGDLCCKSGRDIAQLLFCIHCYFPLDHYLPAGLAAELRRWLQVDVGGDRIDILNGFSLRGEPRVPGIPGYPEFSTGIYEFLRRSEVDPILCAPATVFTACCRLLSQLAETESSHAGGV